MNSITEYLRYGAEQLAYKPVIINDTFSYFTFTKNGVEYSCIGTALSINTHVGAKITRRKDFCREILNSGEICTPHEIRYKAGDELVAFQAKSYVVKPSNSSLGKGVEEFLNWDKAEVYAKSIYTDTYVLIQEKVEGTEYRMVLLDGVIFSMVGRAPTQVIGDGSSTIQELYEIIRSKDDDLTFRYPVTDIHEQVNAYLAKFGKSLETVLDKGETIRLALTANFRQNGAIQGSYIKNILDQDIHPSIHDLAKKIAKVLPLRYMGLDIIFEKDCLTDIALQSYWVIEANSSPSAWVNKFFEPEYNLRLLQAI